MFHFRLLAGQHIDNGPDGKERKFVPGAVIETDKDLRKLDPGGGKFELVESSVTAVVDNSVVLRFAAMTDEDLDEYAKSLDVETKGLERGLIVTAVLGKLEGS